MEIAQGRAVLWFLAIYVVVPCVVGLALLYVSEPFDVRRIRRNLRGRGATLLRCRWSPWGPGWFGTDAERIYEIRYRDGNGRIHQATVKTSVFGGVYYTEDEMM